MLWKTISVEGKYSRWRRAQTLKAVVAKAKAELYGRYIPPCEQKSMSYKRNIPSSIDSKLSSINNGQIMIVSGLKKPSLKERDQNGGRQCTRMAGSISQRNRESSLIDSMHLIFTVWSLRHPTTRSTKTTSLFWSFFPFQSKTWMQMCYRSTVSSRLKSEHDLYLSNTVLSTFWPMVSVDL